MISPEEIEQKSKEFSVSVPRIQRDYAIGWFLFGLFTVTSLKEEFFLKGGNAFRKAYFINGRFSADIDLGIERDIHAEVLMVELGKVCDFVQQKTGIDFKKEENTIKEKFGQFDTEDRWKVFQIRIPFQDFHSHATHLTVTIKMDVTRLDKYMLPLQQRSLIHPYSDEAVLRGAQIRCLKLEELAANKLKCLLQRQHVPDLYDYVFTLSLNNLLPIDKAEVLRVFLQKTIFINNPGVVKGIFTTMPFDYFKEGWAMALVCPPDVLFDVETAIANFNQSILDLFSPYQEVTWSDNTFFSAQVRHSIIRAGRERTLLRMVYDGTERFIEPYSMKYKEARTGTAREYLYVYDRTGSKSNPGIKSFLPDKMERVENTDEKFELRDSFEMELAKAGEMPEDKYLYDPTKPVKQTSPRIRMHGQQSRRSSAFGVLKYSYECGVCNKKFTKSTLDSALGKHKNKRTGLPCYGTWGRYVGRI